MREYSGVDKLSAFLPSYCARQIQRVQNGSAQRCRAVDLPDDPLGKNRSGDDRMLECFDFVLLCKGCTARRSASNHLRTHASTPNLPSPGAMPLAAFLYRYQAHTPITRATLRQCALRGGADD